MNPKCSIPLWQEEMGLDVENRLLSVRSAANQSLLVSQFSILHPKVKAKENFPSLSRNVHVRDSLV